MTVPASDPEVPDRGSLRRSGLRFGILLLLLGGSFAAIRWTPLGELLTAERLQEMLEDLRGAWWAPVVHVGLCIGLGAVGVPATPLLVAGAAIFGALWGTLWNWLGILAASVAGFALAHHLGREFVERVGGDKVRRAEQVLARRGFLPLVAARFLPIPFSLVNAAAAVVGVRFAKFFAASAIGLLPPIAILTYFTDALLEAATGDRAAIVRQLVAVLIAAALLVFAPIVVRRRWRARRLFDLKRRRDGRGGAAPPPFP